MWDNVVESRPKYRRCVDMAVISTRERSLDEHGGQHSQSALLIKYRWGALAGARGAGGGAGWGGARGGPASLRRAPRRTQHVRPRARAMVARTDDTMFGCYGDSYSYRLWSLANVWGACRCEQRLRPSHPRAPPTTKTGTFTADVSGGCEIFVQYDVDAIGRSVIIAVAKCACSCRVVRCENEGVAR